MSNQLAETQQDLDANQLDLDDKKKLLETHKKTIRLPPPVLVYRKLDDLCD